MVDRLSPLLLQSGPQGMTYQEKIHTTSWGEIKEYGPPELLSDQATEFLRKNLPMTPGETVVELGCGTGVLCLFAVLRGAKWAIGTDIDAEAIKAAELNARANSFPQAVFRVGDLLAPVGEKPSLIIFNLPHRPSPKEFNPRFYGGWDGTAILVKAIGQAARRLDSEGRLVFYANSIANPSLIQETMKPDFSVSLIGEKKRYFTPEEFNALVPNLFEHLEALKREGAAEFGEDENGLFFWGRVWEGIRR